MDKAKWDQLQEKLEAAREKVHSKGATDKDHEDYRDLASKVAEARSAWRFDEEEQERRPGPGNPEGSVFKGGNGDGVAAAETSGASGGVS